MTISAKPKAVHRFTYFVALVENGVPKFSENPVPHGKLEAKQEAERLAAKHPGKVFQLFLSSSVAPAYVEPKPKPKTYTGTDLFSNAPAGIYRRLGDAYTRFAVLLGPDGGRAVLFVYAYSNEIEPANPAWNGSKFTFEKVSDNVPLALK